VEADRLIGEPMDFLKAEQLAPSKWRVLAIPYGGPFKGRDLDGEFFSPRTDIKPDWFDRRPLVWNHNLDKSMDDPVIGTADDLEQTKEGWWVTAWLNRSHRYWSEVNALLGQSKVYGSSGSLGANWVRTDRKTGEILVWPFVEETFTPTPSNFYSVVQPIKAIDHFDEAGIGLSPAVRGLLTDLDSQQADLLPDLPSGGDAAAIQRLRDQVDSALERLKTL
jgi:hypothetical protein